MITLKITTIGRYDSRKDLDRFLEAIKYSNAPYHKHIEEALETGETVKYATANKTGTQVSEIQVIDEPRDYKLPDQKTDVHH